LPGTLLAALFDVPDQATRNQTQSRRGWLIVGLSLAVLFGMALLKGQADAGGEQDIDQ
jgi:hypothetical protein